MDQQKIMEALKGIIKPYVPAEVSLDNIGPESNLLEDLKINSADLVDVILDLEERFDIEIDDEAAEQMMTVQQAVQIIRERVQK